MQDRNGIELEPGQSVVAWGHGRLREARVVKLGRTRVTVRVFMDSYGYEKAELPSEVSIVANPIHASSIAITANGEATGAREWSRRRMISREGALNAAARLAKEA